MGKPNQNKLLCQLYVKHRMYAELREFKRVKPDKDRMSVKQKWAVIDGLLGK